MNDFLINSDKDIPIIDINDRITNSGVIDFITQPEVLFPIVKGIYNDTHNFIVIRFVILSNNCKIHGMQTFFKKGTNIVNWYGNGCNGKLLFSTCDKLNDNQINIIQRMVNGDNISINTNDLTYNFDKNIKSHIPFILRLAIQNEWGIGITSPTNKPKFINNYDISCDNNKIMVFESPFDILKNQKRFNKSSNNLFNYNDKQLSNSLNKIQHDNDNIPLVKNAFDNLKRCKSFNS
jgi:hypothetical protein